SQEPVEPPGGGTGSNGSNVLELEPLGGGTIITISVPSGTADPGGDVTLLSANRIESSGGDQQVAASGDVTPLHGIQEPPTYPEIEGVQMESRRYQTNVPGDVALLDSDVVSRPPGSGTSGEATSPSVAKASPILFGRSTGDVGMVEPNTDGPSPGIGSG